MHLSSINRIYFLGIGGIGMSAIARFFHANGISVYGYDRTETKLTRQLQKEGIHIHYNEDHNVTNYNPDLVVYSPAIPKTNIEFVNFQKSTVPMYKRSEVLGILCKNYKTIAVAGTHGKTTVSSMIAHLLYNSNQKVTAFIGGIMANYSTNYISVPESEYVVVEADEFDRSFLTLFPDISVVTSTDADHLDIYGSKAHLLESFNTFIRQTSADGVIFFNDSVQLENTKTKTFSYGFSNSKDARVISNLRVETGKMIFDFTSGDIQINDLFVGMSGKHNVENACAAISVCLELGISEEQIRQGLASFRGVKRRFEKIYESDDISYIDDYAHHPEELKAAINSARLLYPRRNLVGVFQPHLFSRTKDFYLEFASSLSLLDQLYILDIYPARELPIEGVSSRMIAREIKNIPVNLISKEDVVSEIILTKRDVIMTLGAGDIDQIISPLKKRLSEYKFV
ncbi:MAG: UDP-N-acetylmuramate--L-alanine ligase [Bacteroidales bacterium]